MSISFEILVVLCFVMGIGMLIGSVFGILQGLTHLHLMPPGAIVAFIYTTWAIGQFYGKERRRNYVKAFLAYFFGMISFMLSAIPLGILIEAITKN